MSQIPLILRFPKWLSRTLKEELERKKETAFKLWLACHTQEEIAAAVDMTQQAVALWEKEFTKISEADNFVNSPDFDPPLYNVWKQQTKTAGVNHFGNSEVRCQGCPQKALREKRFCYARSNLCYGVIIIVCYRFLKTGSNAS